MADLIRYDDVKHRYWINGLAAPSVTQILDASEPKDWGPWWGMRGGLAAVVELLQRNLTSATFLLSQNVADLWEGKPIRGDAVLGRGGKEKVPLEQLVIDHKLDVNNRRDSAGDRGTQLHEALYKLGIEDRVPSLSDFDPEHRPYVRSLCSWWVDTDPEFLKQEVLVGSVERHYAGRLDSILRVSQGRGLFDLKTSSGHYRSQATQLAGYRQAYDEMRDAAGVTDPDDEVWPQIDHHAVLRLCPGEGPGYQVHACHVDAAVVEFNAKLDLLWAILAHADARGELGGLSGGVKWNRELLAARDQLTLKEAA